MSSETDRKSIAILEDRITKHREWAEYFEKHHEKETDPEFKRLGNALFHRQCIKEYQYIITALNTRAGDGTITPQDMLEGNAIAQKAWDDLVSQLADAKKALADSCPQTRVMCTCGFYSHKPEEPKCIVCEMADLRIKLAKAENSIKVIECIVFEAEISELPRDDSRSMMQLRVWLSEGI